MIQEHIVEYILNLDFGVILFIHQFNECRYDLF
jgi:hypothetical protein